MEYLKIRDVAQRYDITARTLRYYEDVGLLSSARVEGYAYRMYDDKAIARLQQILILRRLNISVKDIIRVFSTPTADALLDVLQKKADNIDDEVALLHELKGIVLDFIRRIQDLDFHKAEDVKRLYDQAAELEKRLSGEEEGPAPLERMMQVASQLEKQPDVRVLSLPGCRMVSSGLETGEMFAPGSKLDVFDKWFSEADKHRHDRFFARDFMWFDPETHGTAWWYALEQGAPEPEGFEVFDFEGGIYAAAVSRDGDDTDGMRVYQGIRQWVDQSGYFDLDERPGHYHMCHIIGTPEIGEAMGFSQLEIYVPIRPKARQAVMITETEEERLAIRKRIDDAGVLFFDCLGDGAHMEKIITPHYRLIRPRAGEQGQTTVYGITLDGPSQPRALIDEIKAMGIHVWWDICFPDEVKAYIFGGRPAPLPEPNNEESYMAMRAQEKPAYPASSTELVVRRVDNAEQFAQWAQMTNALLGDDVLFHPLHHYPLCEAGKMACYLAFMGNHAVGGCCMLREDDLAALYLVITRPEDRRKGVATALCATAIDDAVEDGAELLTACVWPEAKKLARRLGYRYY